MSSLRGEQALKDGLSFEFTWAARHLLEVMEERAEAITLGGHPGESGIDFRLHYADYEEHHQVKRAFGTGGEWTLAALDSQKVLPDFNLRLSNEKVRCYMVSSIPAVQLGYLADRARQSADFATFESGYLTSREYVAWFDDLTNRWDQSREECWRKLRRVYTRPFNEQDQEACCHTMLRSMVVSDVENAWTLLREFCFSHLHQRVTASEVWQWLAKGGIKRQIFDNDSRVVARIEVQTKRYLDGVRQKLIKPPLSRQLASAVVSSLAESMHGEDIVILGSPGGGKSAVVLQIAEACIGKGWSVLAFRLDDLPATITPRQLQQELDLPSSPAACMARASAGKPAVVIIDQLDAVSQYSGRTGTLFDRVSAFVEELRAHRLRNPIHLVIVCREVDWREDGRFRQLHRSHSAQNDAGIHKVENLTDKEINKILISTGFNTAMFSPRQREHLLRRPQYLALLIETNPDRGSLQGIVTPKHLFDAYWTKKQRELTHALSLVGGNQWFEILKHITDKLAETALALTPLAATNSEDEAPLAVTRSSLDRFSQPAIEWMLSNGVLAEGNRRVRFGHESFFDYCFARFFEKREQSLLNYLLQSDQTLIQRGQLRQVLAYLRDENMDAYLKSVGDLLASDQIRPHLKHLLITVFCEVPDPKDREWEIIEPQIQKALADIDTGVTTSVACLVFMGFHGSLPLFKLSCAQGAFSQWLQSSGPLAVERLFRVIHTHQEKAQKEVWILIKPLINNELYKAGLNSRTRFFRVSDSRETFEWLLDEMRKSCAMNAKPPQRGERFYSLTEDLAKNKPEWLAEWLAAVIQERASIQGKWIRELLRSEDIAANKIGPAVERAPREFLAHVLSSLQNAVCKNSKVLYGDWCYGINSNGGLRNVSPDETLFNSLILALYQILQQDRDYAIKILSELRYSESTAMHALHAAVLCRDNEICTALVSDYLAKGGNAFSVIYKGRLAACELLKTHASRLSDDQLFTIETAILNSWPNYELKKQECYAVNSPKTCAGNWRGHQQMELLRSFPSEHLSEAGTKRLAELERKFDSLNALYAPARIAKPINKSVIVAWKPERFLHAINSRQKRTSEPRRFRIDRDASVGSVLREAVTQRPGEFIQFLGQCDSNTTKAFLDEIEFGVMNLELNSELALEAAKHFKRLGEAWARRSVSMLEKIKGGGCLREAFVMVVDFAQNGKGITESQSCEDGKRGQQLESMASNCVRGLAIGAMRQMLWAEPELLSEVKACLPELMSDSCPVIRAEMASVCYAVAFEEQNQQFATDLFLRLITDRLPDEHVLSSHWPISFIRTGLKDAWHVFQPILVQMMKSTSSEVRRTAACLICIALVSGKDAIKLAKECVASHDPQVRAACAEVFSRNLDAEHGKPWTTEALLSLADDADSEVCQAIGFGQNENMERDFGPLSDFLTRYVKTRAFVRNPGGLIEAIAGGRSLLPETVFDIVQTIVIRLNEPVENDSDHLIWHIESVTPILTRLYHENRDGALRKRALDLIDMLCVNGSFNHVCLDK